MLRSYLGLPRAVHLLALGMLVTRAGSFVIVYLTIYLTRAAGYSESFATLCVGAFGAGSCLAGLLGGYLADRWGRRPTILLSTFGGAAILLVVSTLTGRVPLVVGVFVYGTIVDLYRPAAQALIADLVPSDARSLAFGMNYVAINLGFAIGANAGALLADVGFAWVFWGDALTTAGFGAIVALGVPETRPAAAAAASDAVTVEAAGSGYGRVFADGAFLAFIGACSLNNIVFQQCISTLPIFLTESGWEPRGYGALISLNGLLIVAFQLPLANWLRRFDRLHVIAWSYVLVALAFASFGRFTAPSAFVGAIVVWTLGEMLQAPFLAPVVSDLAPVELRARYLGLLSMTFAISIAVGAPLGGLVLERCGPVVLWSGAAILGCVAALTQLAIRPAILRRCSAETASPVGTNGSAG